MWAMWFALCVMVHWYFCWLIGWSPQSIIKFLFSCHCLSIAFLSAQVENIPSASLGDTESFFFSVCWLVWSFPVTLYANLTQPPVWKRGSVKPHFFQLRHKLFYTSYIKNTKCVKVAGKYIQDRDIKHADLVQTASVDNFNFPVTFSPQFALLHHSVPFRRVPEPGDVLGRHGGRWQRHSDPCRCSRDAGWRHLEPQHSGTTTHLSTFTAV